jgi:hypothetical protein
MMDRKERFHIVETWHVAFVRPSEWQAAPLVVFLQGTVLPATVIPPTP